jgi:hypothetical protein
LFAFEKMRLWRVLGDELVVVLRLSSLDEPLSSDR